MIHLFGFLNTSSGPELFSIKAESRLSAWRTLRAFAGGTIPAGSHITAKEKGGRNAG